MILKISLDFHYNPSIVIVLLSSLISWYFVDWFMWYYVVLLGRLSAHLANTLSSSEASASCWNWKTNPVNMTVTYHNPQLDPKYPSKSTGKSLGNMFFLAARSQILNLHWIHGGNSGCPCHIAIFRAKAGRFNCRLTRLEKLAKGEVWAPKSMVEAHGDRIWIY